MCSEKILPAIQIKVLGPLDIRLENGETLAFESTKAKGLLVYLAVEAGQSHSRNCLASLLWPDRPDSAALANLRHTLSSLRTSLGERLKIHSHDLPPLFEITYNTIRFNRAASAWVDLGEVEERLALAAKDCAECLPDRILQLSAAVGLYRGHFMEGFSIKGCPEFEDWMLLRRENTSLKLQKALRRLATAHELEGEYEQALSALRQLLQHEPWDESAHRRVMAILAVHDQRNAAIGQYEQCRKILRRELNVEPEEDTVLLYEQIRLGLFHEPSVNGIPVNISAEQPDLAARPVRSAQPHFVGRSFQLARMHHALDLALDGRGQVLFIKGEAGSGKTSLAWEFASQAMDLHNELIVAAGRCNAVSGFENPFFPFRELIQMMLGIHEINPAQNFTPGHLRRLTGAFPEVIKSVLTFGPDLIGSFIPEESLSRRIETFSPGKYAWQTDFQLIWQRTPAGRLPIPPQVTWSPIGSADKTIESFANILVDLAHHRPFILFLDDLQWADTRSINLLYYLCKRLTESRVLILGAYRPQDIALGRREAEFGWERHPFEPVRLELQREFGEIELDLDQSKWIPTEETPSERMPSGQMEFIDALVDCEPNDLGKNFRQTLFGLTNGNPLFAVELLRKLKENTSLVQDAAGRWVEGHRVEWENLPARVEAVVAERIGRLPPMQQTLLRAASVQGEAFSAEVLASVIDQPVCQVVGWLSGPLSREQMIVEAITAGWSSPAVAGQSLRLSRYHFRHGIFQDYLYKRLDVVERSTLHEATAVSLENLYGQAASQIALQLAWHFEQAGLIPRAIEYILAASRQAMQQSARQQAAALYDRCLGLIQQLPDSPVRTRLELQISLPYRTTVS